LRPGRGTAAVVYSYVTDKWFKNTKRVLLNYAQYLIMLPFAPGAYDAMYSTRGEWLRRFCE